MSTSGRKRRARRRIRNNPLMFVILLKMTNMIEYHGYNSKPYHPGEHMRMVDVERFENRDDARASLEYRFQIATPLYIVWPDKYQNDIDLWIDSEYWKPGAKLPKWLKAACIKMALVEKAIGVFGEALRVLFSRSQYFIGGNHNEENNTQTEEMGN